MVSTPAIDAVADLIVAPAAHLHDEDVWTLTGVTKNA
jgi:hypothetical protein